MNTSGIRMAAGAAAGLCLALAARVAVGQDATYSTDTHIYLVWTQTGVANTWQAPLNMPAEVLVVAGGGSGGNGLGGGGGAGGVVRQPVTLAGGVDYSITVGRGGVASTAYRSAGFNGENSFFDTLVADGGGGGGAWNDRTGRSGGSGGGSANTTRSSGVSGQGSAGGIFNGNYRTGGGGGYSQQGEDGIAVAPVKGGDGGDGIDLTEWLAGVALGDDGWFAGGGGGTDYQSDRIGFGGRGGGGDGGQFTANVGAGMDGTGGGGGASGNNDQISGKGGDGIVIVRHARRIVNLPVDVRTDTTAELSGRLHSTASAPTTVYFVWDTSNRGTNMADWATHGTVVDMGERAEGAVWTNTLSELTPNTIYWFNHAASNEHWVAWGAEDAAWFTTLGPPAVDNAEGATSVGVSVAVLNGTLLDGAPANVYVDLWADGSGMTNRFDLGSRELGAFSVEAAGLTADTPYQYRCFVSNVYGTAWADTIASFTTLAAVYTDGNVTWSGDGAVPYWDMPANWAGNAAPTNPTAATVTFGTNGQAVVGLVETDRQVGGITFGVDRYLGPMSHTLNLNQKRLTVAGDIRRTNWETETLILTNGTLQIGTDAVAGNINLSPNWGTPTLRLSPGTVLDARNLNNVTLGFPGWGNGTSAYLDLRGAEVAGGVLAMQNLYTRMAASGSSHVYLDGNTLLSHIAISNRLEICTPHSRGSGYIGDPLDDGRLPANISVTVGVSPSTRGSIWISRVGSTSATGAGANGKLVASDGGSFTAYLSELAVVRQETTSIQTHTGILDIRAMTTCLIDAETLTVGSDAYTTPSTGYDIRGELYLCSGSVTADVAEIGASMGVGWGKLSLSNTLFRVNDAFTLNHTAQVTIRLGANPIGLDVDGTFTDQGDGTINVHFMEAPPAGTTNWAIRVKGDALGILSGLVSSERLTPTGDYEGKAVGLLFDGEYTYYAMVDDTVPFPPIAAAHASRTYEIAPGGTLEIHVSDIDNGSFDPAGRPLSLSISSNAVDFSQSLTFHDAGTYTVTLKAIAGDDEVTATCTVYVNDVHPGATEGTRTWLGAAPPPLLDRREWMWSENWVEGTPPAATTTGTIRFREHGQTVTGKLDVARQVGGIAFGVDQNVGAMAHTVDLNQQRLTVAGNITRTDWESQTLAFTNGILQIGTDAVAGNVNLNQRWGSAALVLQPGTVFDAYNLDTVTFGQTDHGTEASITLDLRGAEIANGTLALTNLILRQSSSVLLDDATALSLISIANNVEVCTARSASTGFIGNPVGGNRLPAGVSVAIGVSPSQRGRVWISRIIGSANMDGRLEASGGGNFTAYVSELAVVRLETTGTHTFQGRLDIGRMDSCMIDAETITVGSDRYTTPAANHNIRGTLTLCPGTVVAEDVEIGSTLGVGWGRVTTSNTIFTVTDSLALNKTAEVTTFVGSSSSGLDIVNPDGGAFTMADDATLTLRFLTVPDTLPHYGLRWAGNHVATLQGWLGESDGRLVVDSSGLPRPAEVFHYQGATYIGVPPPPGSLILLR